jgi:uncharacterized protein YndB with AHSA1/START domain
MTAASDDPRPSRSIEVELEVPGTPEEVWEAIATGPGITAWFVPAEVAEREGGPVRLHFGVLGDDESVVSAWEPPHRFRCEGGAIAHEVVVEARSGGTCVVRLVNSGFDSDWDDQLDGVERGWLTYLHNLRLHLESFAGRRCETVLVMVPAAAPAAGAWRAFGERLGLADARPGDRVASGPGVPPLAGTVERVDPDAALLRLDAPAPGTALLGVVPTGESALLLVHAYLYGDGAAGVAAREQDAWQTWLDDHVATHRAPA